MVCAVYESSYFPLSKAQTQIILSPVVIHVAAYLTDRTSPQTAESYHQQHYALINKFILVHDEHSCIANGV